MSLKKQLAVEAAKKQAERAIADEDRELSRRKGLVNAFRTMWLVPQDVPVQFDSHHDYKFQMNTGWQSSIRNERFDVLAVDDIMVGASYASSTRTDWRIVHDCESCNRSLVLGPYIPNPYGGEDRWLKFLEGYAMRMTQQRQACVRCRNESTCRTCGQSL